MEEDKFSGIGRIEQYIKGTKQINQNCQQILSKIRSISQNRIHGTETTKAITIRIDNKASR